MAYRVRVERLWIAKIEDGHVFVSVYSNRKRNKYYGQDICKNKSLLEEHLGHELFEGRYVLHETSWDNGDVSEIFTMTNE